MLRRVRSAVCRIRLGGMDEWKRIDVIRRELGVVAGVRIRITGDVNWGSEPYLIELGDDVTLTDGIRFVTHDGGAALVRDEHPGTNIFGRIAVGSRVFIGVGTIILPGVSIGSNVVIGAGSVVTHDIPDDVVAAGVPARVIRPIEEYRAKVLRDGVQVHHSDPVARRRAIIASLAPREDTRLDHD